MGEWKIKEGCISCNGGGIFILDAAITIVDSWEGWLGLGGGRVKEEMEWNGKGREGKGKGKGGKGKVCRRAKRQMGTYIVIIDRVVHFSIAKAYYIRVVFRNLGLQHTCL